MQFIKNNVEISEAQDCQKTKAEHLDGLMICSGVNWLFDNMIHHTDDYDAKAKVAEAKKQQRKQYTRTVKTLRSLLSPESAVSGRVDS